MDNPHITGIQRIVLMGIPLDIVPEEELTRVALELVEKNQFHRIIFLNYAKFMKARRDMEYQAFVKRAALVLPVSKSLEGACKFLKLPLPVRHYPFEFIIKLLGFLEEKRKSLYLLGEEHKGVQTIASNMRTSFPGINLVGRHSGYYSKDKENSILTAIQKATPALLLVGPGVPGKDKWLFRQHDDLPVRIGVYSDESFRIMAGKKHRPSKKSFKSGTHELYKTLINPFRLFRLFSYLWFTVLKVYYRLKK